MAAPGRQVSRLGAPAWARAARTPPPPRGQRRAEAAPPRPLATAPGGAGPRERRAACAGPDGVASRLRDWGFRDAHVGALLAARPGTRPQQLLGVVSELLLLGLHPEPACGALTRSPALLGLPLPQLRRRSGHLRKLGLGEGKLKRVLSCCPEVLSMPQRDLDAVLAVLRDKCLFSAQQVTELLHRCPHVLRADPTELEYKFQYAHFRLGLKHADVVKTDVLQYSMAKVRQRHVFLERLGRYQTPDKKGQTRIPNPPLKDILRVSEAEFLARTAHAPAEEFEVFKKLLAREEAEASENHLLGDGDEDGEGAQGSRV
ncbi:transcription termination factor 4, mitochondrial [Talpa occidentalis]|uniref:transcription termination factor 4, mitochondrial n=1 Tax=Talpa occidentalis TaxID=50954 RepID=UPI001890901B|nr:transcription termination factor 4, mitochondrial [Talpa occidentalis]